VTTPSESSASDAPLTVESDGQITLHLDRLPVAEVGHFVDQLAVVEHATWLELAFTVSGTQPGASCVRLAVAYETASVQLWFAIEQLYESLTKSVGEKLPAADPARVRAKRSCAGDPPVAHVRLFRFTRLSSMVFVESYRGHPRVLATAMHHQRGKGLQVEPLPGLEMPLQVFVDLRAYVQSRRDTFTGRATL